MVGIMSSAAFIGARITVCFALGRFRWLIGGTLVWLPLAFRRIGSAHLWEGLLLRRVDVLTLLNRPCDCLSGFGSYLTELMNYNAELMLFIDRCLLGLVRF